MASDLVYTARLDVEVGMDKPVPETGHILQTTTQISINDPGLAQNDEHVAVIAGPSTSLARYHVVPDVETRLDDDGELPLSGATAPGSSQRGWQSAPRRRSSEPAARRLAEQIAIVPLQVRLQIEVLPDRPRGEVGGDLGYA